jgi:signal transduction histidine kinase
MEEKYEDQMRVVQDIQKARPDAICKTLIYLHKDNLMMTHLFTIYKVLDCNDRSRFEKKTHKVHSLLLNVLYLWRSDFDEKKVRVHVADSDSRVLCDFNTIQAAFILFLDNAFKYTQSKSDMFVSFEENDEMCVACFRMRSLLVEPEERILILEDERRGKHARSRTDLRGQGYGMGRITRLIELNGGTFSAKWGDKTDSSDYAQNEFSFCLQLSKAGRHH